MILAAASSGHAQDPQLDDGATAGQPLGADVIVSTILQPSSYACENTATGIITGFGVGTMSCNIGDEPIRWEELTVNHPVIRSSMFRLKNSRFEQIGISWVKHGFYATNDSDCGLICTAPPQHIGDKLWPGCSDPYSASLNSMRMYLGQTSQINAFTGAINGPVTHPPESGQRARLQVHNVDLDPVLNVNARYYVESQYISADDAADRNSLNNVSHQRINVITAASSPTDTCTGSCSGNENQRFCINLTDFLHETEPGIKAWKNFDPAVVETYATVPGEGTFILSAKASPLGNGLWHYEYALHNLNSDRSGRAFTVPVSIGASIQNVGFHDVEYHSGEPFDNTDWTANVIAGKIIWTGADYSVSPNGNALRWGTLYNFRFDTNAPPTQPGATTVTLDLFKPGAPDKITINTIGPVVGFIDCQPNGVADLCDVTCDGIGCSAPCGGSEDCNTDGVPDECQDDCNENGIVDWCDLEDNGGASPDCNENTVPDECEEDCNDDGFPDNCVVVPDTDDDSWNDCEDLCPTTTPPNGCLPPPYICCRYPSQFTIQYYPYFSCLSDGGQPLCHGEYPGACADAPPCPTSFCREGCLVGDGDGDGDFDLVDFQYLISCFSGEKGTPAFVDPSADCLRQFDFDGNEAVDLDDLEQFRRELAGPGGS